MLPYRILSVANRIMLAVSIISGTVLPTTLTQAYKTTPRALSREEGIQDESQLFLHSLSEDRGDGSQSVPPSFPPQDFDDQDNLIVDEPPGPVIFELSAEPVKDFLQEWRGQPNVFIPIGSMVTYMPVVPTQVPTRKKYIPE